MHQKYMRLTKILLYIPLALIIALGIPFVSSVVIEEIVIPEAIPYTKVIKILFFYITQLSLGFIVYKLTTGKGLKELLNIQWIKLNSMGWVVKFTFLWLGLVLIFYWAAVRFVPDFHDYVRSWWVPSSRNVYEELLTTCLQAGFFEELFFRAVVSMILLEAFGRSFESLRKEARIVLVVYSGLLFSGAHIYYQLNPFLLLPLDYIQLTVTFILGCLWSYQYYKTRNILGPIVAHTLANIIQVSIGFYYSYFVIG